MFWLMAVDVVLSLLVILKNGSVDDLVSGLVTIGLDLFLSFWLGCLNLHCFPV